MGAGGGEVGFVNIQPLVLEEDHKARPELHLPEAPALGGDIGSLLHSADAAPAFVASAFEPHRVPREVVGHEGRDEVIRVIVSLLPTQDQRDARRRAGLFQKLRAQASYWAQATLSAPR